MPRLALFTTHPIQYQVPYFRALSEAPDADFTIYYGHLHNDKTQGKDFGETFT